MSHLKKYISIEKFFEIEKIFLSKKTFKKKFHYKIFFQVLSPAPPTQCFPLKFANKTCCKFTSCMFIFTAVFNVMHRRYV